jgi:hypothetical protein
MEEVSLGHIHGSYIPDSVKLEYILLSGAGAVTHVHTDPSGTFVMYILIHGEKTFYMLEPTPSNLSLFNEFLEIRRKSGNKKLFFPSHRLLATCCKKVVISAGECIFLAPDVLHAVETMTPSVAFAMNCIHKMAIGPAANAYKNERVERIAYNKCFPNFIQLALTHLTMQLNGVLKRPTSEGAMIDFVRLWTAVASPRGYTTTTSDVKDVIEVHKHLQAYVCMTSVYIRHVNVLDISLVRQ